MCYFEKGPAHARGASASKSIITVYFCVSISQIISYLPTYPPKQHNLTYTYLYLFHYRLFMCYFEKGPAHARGASASKSIITVYFCVSISQIISSLPTYPPKNVNLTCTYPYLFHFRCCSLRTCHV